LIHPYWLKYVNKKEKSGPYWLKYVNKKEKSGASLPAEGRAKARLVPTIAGRENIEIEIRSQVN
jgi:hypothetical protein